MTHASDSKNVVTGSAASGVLARWIGRWGVRLLLWSIVVAGLTLEGYGRAERRLQTRMIGLATAIAAALCLIWEYQASSGTKPGKSWRMPVPTDPNLPIDCPSCGVPLRHLSTGREPSGEVHFYRCQTHGGFRLDNDGLKPM